MAEATRRVEVEDGRGTFLRASFHAEDDLVVVSLWRDGLCIGTFRAGPDARRELTAFLTGIGATAGRPDDVTAAVPAVDATRAVPAVDVTRAVPAVRRPGLADSA